MTDFQLKHILNVEGGFVNDPDDAGGATYAGITISTLSDYLGRKATVQDVKNLANQPQIVKSIYDQKYYHSMGLSFVKSDKQQLALLDQGVNRGTKTALIMAQSVLNDMGVKGSNGKILSVDGVMGTNTSHALMAAGETFNREFIQAAQHAYWDIVLRKPTQQKFFKGWLNRTHILQDQLWLPEGDISQLPVINAPKPDESPVVVKMTAYQWSKNEGPQVEIAGKKHNMRIVWYHSFTTLKATTDEVAWCSSHMCAAQESTGHKSTKSAAARSWLQWGIDVTRSPKVGDVVILWRGSKDGWQGHVAFLSRPYKQGDKYIYLFGGNQGNALKESAYDANQLLGIRRAA